MRSLLLETLSDEAFDPLILRHGSVQGQEGRCPHPGSRVTIFSATVVIRSYNLYHLSKDFYTVVPLVRVATTELYFNVFLNWKIITLLYNSIPHYLYDHYLSIFFIISFVKNEVVESKCQYSFLISQNV